MANEITPLFGGSSVELTGAKIASKLQESAGLDPRGGVGDSVYLNFSGKIGRYSIGTAGRDTDEDEWWVVNIASFEDGHVCWKGGRPAAARMANIFTDPPVATPSPEELGPFSRSDGEGWYQAKSVTLRSVHTGEQGYFRINSKSGVSVVAELQRAIVERAEAGMSCWPVITLGVASFTAQGKKNFKPVITPICWLDDDDIVALGVDGADPDSAVEYIETAMENTTRRSSKVSAQPDGDEPGAPSPRRERRRL